MLILRGTDLENLGKLSMPLSSFAVLFQVEKRSDLDDVTFSVKENDPWPCITFFDCILELLEDDAVLNGYSEGLELYLEFGFKQIAQYEFENGWSGWRDTDFWREIQNHCPMKSSMEQNDERSRRSVYITQLICKILDKVKENGRNDKLMIKCIGICELTVNCEEFLRFWFRNEDFDFEFDWDMIQFVAH